MYFTPVLILTLLRHIFFANLQFFYSFLGNKKSGALSTLLFAAKKSKKCQEERI